MVNGDKKQKAKCVVKCWVEDWEHTALLDQGEVAEAKL